MMAHQRMYVSKPFKYKNRMLTAGDSVIMPNPAVRLYSHLGFITDEHPAAKVHHGLKTPNQARKEAGLSPIAPPTEPEPSPEATVDEAQQEPAAPPAEPELTPDQPADESQPEHTEPAAPVLEPEQPAADLAPAKQAAPAAPKAKKHSKKARRKK
jgi:hypothetical protein